jgi:hypothetical protein
MIVVHGRLDRMIPNTLLLAHAAPSGKPRHPAEPLDFCTQQKLMLAVFADWTYIANGPTEPSTYIVDEDNRDP